MKLTVTQAAIDLQLLSTAELRAAAGLDPLDSSQDTELAALGLQAAAALAGACGVARAGYAASYLTDSPPLRGQAPVTLKMESLSEVFRYSRQYETLYLARWPVAEITSVTVGTTPIDASQYEYDTATGALNWISTYWAWGWWPACPGRIVVEYDAGYDPIPAGLKSYASRLVSLYTQTMGEDPSEKRVEIPDVITIDRWVDKEADIIVPEDIMSGLRRDGFRRIAIA